MLRVYERLGVMGDTDQDPYLSTVARAGSQYLTAYQKALQMGVPREQAFAITRDQIIAAEQANRQSKDDELFFVENKGDLTDFPEVQGKGRAQMLDFINKKGKPLSITEARKLQELTANLDRAALSVDNPQDPDSIKEGKEQAYEAKHGRGPKTAAEWAEAWTLYRAQTVNPRQKELDDYIEMLTELGKRIPGQATNVPQIPAPQNALPQEPAAVPVAPQATPSKTPVPQAPAAPAARKPGLSPLSQIRNVLKP
jgi:hypothetical protein